MAYLHQVSFDIGGDKLPELRIGASLQRVIGYLKTLLPNETGFISAQAYYAVGKDQRIHVLVNSRWDTWEDLRAHRDSALAEDKILREFEPHVRLQDLDVAVYREVD